MKYEDLNNKRKLAVDLIAKYLPHTVTSGVIGFKELNELWAEIKAGTKEAPKLGYPIWITLEDAFRTERRGVYRVPHKGAVNSIVLPPAKAIKQKPIVTKRPETTLFEESSVTTYLTDEEFEAELRKEGIL